mmetsp:Transcript_17918/g.32396  ORF Transcript_17918/g.32396 Transcript_17918/m.32396 type:complete len:341 (+) Transcript_17918:2631-3653(+)
MPEHRFHHLVRQTAHRAKNRRIRLLHFLFMEQSIAPFRHHCWLWDLQRQLWHNLPLQKLDLGRMSLLHEGILGNPILELANFHSVAVGGGSGDDGDVEAGAHDIWPEVEVHCRGSFGGVASPECGEDDGVLTAHLVVGSIHQVVIVVAGDDDRSRPSLPLRMIMQKIIPRLGKVLRELLLGLVCPELLRRSIIQTDLNALRIAGVGADNFQAGLSSFCSDFPVRGFLVDGTPLHLEDQSRRVTQHPPFRILKSNRWSKALNINSKSILLIQRSNPTERHANLGNLPPGTVILPRPIRQQPMPLHAIDALELKAVRFQTIALLDGVLPSFSQDQYGGGGAP